MNRRDFLKITAIFATVAAVPALPTIASTKDEPFEVKWKGGRAIEAVRNAMLDALVARAAFLAIYDTAGEMIGITPIGPIAPVSGGAVNLKHLSIEVRHACEIGAVKILDAEESPLFPVEVNWAGSTSVIAGEICTVGGRLSS